MNQRTFPDSFVWGAATAAYQIEGAATRGRPRPVDLGRLLAHPGRTLGGDTGDVADDHYHRWRDDVALMSELGLGAYRLSISWPRVQPGGRGPLNPEGVAFYTRLLDALRAAGIAPVVTLYHWDLPSELEAAGGWTSRETAYAFAEYARAMARALGERVALWTTLNEPWCSAFLGYAAGVHAPGRTEPAAALAAAHHLNLAHGLAAAAIRDELRRRHAGLRQPQPARHPPGRPRVRRRPRGRARGGPGRQPHLPRPDARRLLPHRAARADPRHHRRRLRPARRHDPHPAAPGRPRRELLLHQPRAPQRRAAPPAGPAGTATARPAPGWASTTCEFLPPAGPTTAMGWNIEPDGIYELLTALDNAYDGLPLMVTENGAAFDDVARARRRGARPRAHGLPAPPHRRRRPRPRGRRQRAAGTSCGPCWTTSSGRTATASGSASSGSTTTRSGAPSRTPPAGTPSSPRTGTLPD